VSILAGEEVEEVEGDGGKGVIAITMLKEITRGWGDLRGRAETRLGAQAASVGRRCSNSPHAPAKAE